MSRRMGYGPKPTMQWDRTPGFGGGGSTRNSSCGSRHTLVVPKEHGSWMVIHCGHPTANWPWYGQRPDGSMIIDSNGYAFQFLQDAKYAVECEYRKAVLHG